MSDAVINANGLTKQFGEVTAVNQLDLTINKGEVYGFLGPNGCGKTTAIRMLTGLLMPTSGDVSVLGLSLPKQANLLRYKIGYMTQKFSLYDDLTVAENLAFLADAYSLKGQYKRSRIDELLSIYDLAARANQLAGSMSGGQKQRLALAGATIHKPELLFLDEPTSAVDPENRRDFWEKLFDLSELGTSILVSTHYMDEAERCHKLAILEKGIKRADDSPEQLMANLNCQVVEVEVNNSRSTKRSLESHQHIHSATQLGARLRVLVDNLVNDAETLLLQFDDVVAAKAVRPNLEDVFVSVTGEHNREQTI
ncbi:putative ABC transporter ATP-binding protein YbhF [Pseudoalteromonas sp. P1-9]|uniref:ABC transporter ATP-binding protein n=1 Tax=Pseudoalteromonas sp. P1-9 TaxID=1710354 RepID=UPI0006D61694|nr:ABC transporter ATP-binding protein [Pseudoalteromonas sp. P1-9]KPV95086.1 putative ABC transporter ATP-binding protein YbhF [Pseudoalteromonas sp. P1-9]